MHALRFQVETDGAAAVNVHVLGLLVMSASTPIPLVNQTSRQIDTQPADDELFGAIHAGTAQLFYDSIGYQLQIRGSFVKS